MRNTQILWAFVALWSGAVLVPVGLLLLWSFLKMEDYSFVWSLTTDAYRHIIDYNRYRVGLETLRIAATVTFIELLIALPFCLWLAKGTQSARLRAIVLALLTIPFFLSLASRTVVFRPILGRNGLLNTLLTESGMVSEPLNWLLFSDFSVHLGLLAAFFPTMALPIFLTMTLIDDELIHAARDLGAAPARVFFDVIRPLAMPGIVAGIIFTFVPMLGETVVPQLLGGGQVNMLGGSITSLMTVLNYAVAAALSVMVLVILATLLLLLRLSSPNVLSLAAIFEGLKR